jgi:hypothetical protein
LAYFFPAVAEGNDESLPPESRPLQRGRLDYSWVLTVSVFNDHFSCGIPLMRPIYLHIVASSGV